ncbi:hypothetical protein KEM56_000153 [Ascosphaera pollenicola]|nr:hypothetical protein KEM56_000153 [Ascosphaera pollenicola]
MDSVPPWFNPVLPERCEPVSPFHEAISAYLHTCMPTTPALISSLLGTLSIITWLFAQLPQVYENYKLKSTAGLSVYFLAVWCLGDSTNLVGATMTGQASWQVMLAAYYTCVDLTLVFQYWWYTHVKPQKLRKLRVGEYSLDDGLSQPQSSWPVSHTSARDDEMVETTTGNQGIIHTSQPRVRPSNSLPQLLLASSVCVAGANAAPVSGVLHVNALAARSTTLATILSGQSLQHKIGMVISWSSTALYLGSRIPQLLKNYRRKSTSGLSPLLFACAFTGNVFYSASLLTNPRAWHDFPAYGDNGFVREDGSNRLEWVMSAIPFFLGAAGVLMLDAAVGIQFLMYNKTTELVLHGERIIDSSDSEDDEQDGYQQHHPHHSKSKAVNISGWMRGWIPSLPGSVPRSEEFQERQLLLAPHEQPYGTH